MADTSARRLSRAEWVAGAFDALCDGGVEALRVEPLAARLGVTKGSFYHHFDNRRSLQLEVLAEWERAGTSQVIDRVERPGDGSSTRLRLLAHQTFAADHPADVIEVRVRAWASSDETAAAAVERVDARRVDYVAALLREIGLPAPLARRRARLLYRAMVGEFTWRLSGGPAVTKREIDELVDLITASVTADGLAGSVTAGGLAGSATADRRSG